MKKHTLKLILGLHLLIGLSANAQNFKFGFIVGFDIANAHVTKRPLGYNSRIYYPMAAINLNGFVSYKSSEFWGITFEPGFIEKGGKLKEMDNYYRNIYYYLQLPILGNFYVSEKLYVSIGSEFSYMIKTLYPRRYEISGLVGINYQLNDKFELGARYNHGLTYVTELTFTDNFGEVFERSREYNQYFQIDIEIQVITGAKECLFMGVFYLNHLTKGWFD